MNNLVPITDPNKRVTDTNVLKIINEKNLNLDFVEFHDYNRERPYSKLYTLHETGENILMCSGLPMVRKTDNTKLVPGFEQESSGKYWIKNNLFDGYVGADGEIHISCVNDQPNGPIAGNELHSNPVLTVGNSVVPITNVTLLETDPLNPNYHENVLEFDYSGVCKRRIRLVEGRFKGTWEFSENPNADIRIKYNKTGNLNVKYGKAFDGDDKEMEVLLPSNDEEYVPMSSWKNRIQPITIGDSGTFYPDANPETNTVDGGTNYQGNVADWGTIIAYDGNGSQDSSADDTCLGFITINGSNNWRLLYRSIFLFNTAALTADVIVTAATMSAYGTLKLDQGSTGYGANVYSSNPASNTSIANGDHDTLGTTQYASTISYASLSSSGYNNFTINATGLAAISKTGITKFGLREAVYDAAGTNPGSIGSDKYQIFNCKFAEAGDGYKPKLVITYTPPPAANLFINTYRRRR